MKNFLPLLLVSLLVVGIAPTSAQENVADKLARERQEQTGTAITIIFDDSGSMNADQKLSQAKSAFLSWLSHVPEDYKLSLITFKDGGKILIPLGENNRPDVTRTVSRLSANSATPICSALRLAAQQIENRRQKITPYERHVVLLFTDGQETQDPGGITAVQRNIKALRAANVEVAGVGFHGQGDYMNGIATRYYSASDEASLSLGLSKIDAEIDDTSDIVVSPEELAVMKTAVPAVAASFTSDNPPAATSAPATVNPVPRKKFSFGTMIFLAAAFLLLRSLFRKKR